MPELIPFRGLRYARLPLDDSCPEASPLIAPPYDVVADPSVLEARHANNAVRLILPRDEPGIDRYTAAATRLAKWEADGVLATDSAARLYRYSMTFTRPDGSLGHTVGVIGLLTLPDEEGAVLPHERTLPKTKSDRLALLRATRANLDPIWVLSLAGGVTELVGSEREPLVCATDDDGVVHRLAAIDDPEQIAAVRDAVAGAPAVIADGHHRYETARAYRAEQPAEPGATSIMALLVECAPDELHVAPIHRLVRDGGDIRARLTPWFDVEPIGPNSPDGVDALRLQMTTRHTLGLVDDAGVALLSPSAALDERLAAFPAELRDVDAARVDAVAGAIGLAFDYQADDQTVAAAVTAGEWSAALLLRPVTVDQIRAVAAVGLRMPEKTSYFWPKPRTGMVFRSLASSTTSRADSSVHGK